MASSNIYTPSNWSPSEIRAMQTELSNRGYDIGSTGADGIWGSKTSAALSQFKADTGGSNTYGNTVGKETLSKLGLWNSSSSGGSGGSRTSTTTSNTTKTSTTNATPKTSTTNATPNTNSATSLDELAALANSSNALDSALYSYYTSQQTENPNIRNQWDTALDDAQKIYETNVLRLGDVYDQGVAQANQTADSAARQQYIAYKQSKNKLGEQLSTNGITGGASETALNSILNAYSSALAQNEASRQSALASLNNEYRGNLSDLLANYQENQANINNQYGGMMTEDAANKQEKVDSTVEGVLQSYLDDTVKKWNENVSENILKKKPAYIWTDNEGRLHYNNSASAAAAAKAQGYTVIAYDKFVDSYTPKSKTSSSSGSLSSDDSSDIWGTSSTKASSGTNTNSTPKQDYESLVAKKYANKQLDNLTNTQKLSPQFAETLRILYGLA